MLSFIAVTVTCLVSYETFSLISQSSSLCDEIYLLFIVTAIGSLKFLPLVTTQNNLRRCIYNNVKS